MRKIALLLGLIFTFVALGQSASSVSSALSSVASSANSSLASVSSTASSVASAPSGGVGTEAPVSIADFLDQIINFVKTFGGVSMLLKISGIVLLIIASFKVSFLNTYVWSKLGNFQAWAAPILGLIAGVLGVGTGGAPITLAAIFTYLSAGSGALILHELLDTIKAIPGLGSVYLSVINAIESVLGGPAAKGAPALPPKQS